MKLADTLSRSTGSLKRAKSRTLLTAAAIAVGAFSMTMALAMGQGGGDYANRIITTNTDTHSLWVLKKQDDQGSASRPSEYTGTPAVRFNKVSVNPIDQYDLDKIAATGGVEEAQPVFVIDNAVISRSGQKEYQAVVNVARQGSYRVYSAGDGSTVGDDEAILPDGYREALGFATPASAIGQTVVVKVMNKNDPKGEAKRFSFRVKAVMRQSSMSLALAPTAMLVSVNSARKLNDHIVKGTFAQNRFVAANAHLRAGADMDATKQQLTSEGYLAQTPGDVYGALYQFVSVLQLVLAGFGVLAVMTAVFSIINTQYISVLERVQEVGLMKALGMDGKDVGRLFQIEAGMIGLVGSSVGTLAGLIFGTILNPMVTRWLGFDPGTELMKFTVLDIFGVILLLTVTAVLAGLLPARRAAQLDPVDALRSDRL
jgi:putative ABC transport system permease protein